MTALKLALQKSGRLSDDSLALLKRCGLNFDFPKGRLIVPCDDFPIDLLMVRDDDIPNYVGNAACDMGIVGYDVFREHELTVNNDRNIVKILRRIGFGRCRLSIAIPEKFEWQGLESLNNKRIATSHVASLKRFLKESSINASVIEMSGAVEIAPGMGLADAICDLVSSGATLRSNGLREVAKVYESEAVLIAQGNESPLLQTHLDRFLLRLDGVLKAQGSRYIMMNAKRQAVADISRVAPGLSEPTVMPLAGTTDRVAIHMVAAENVFWETLEKLKAFGATDILVLPIEKMME